MKEPRLPVALAAVAVGGVVGASARFGLSEWFEPGSGFPWLFFAINVVGSGALAAVGALAVTRRRPLAGLFLGTGVLGGFTTMSAASEQTVVLVDQGHALTALLYAGGTLAAALAAVHLVRTTTGPRP